MYDRIIPKLCTAAAASPFLVQVAEALYVHQPALCTSPNDATLLKALVAEILINATARLDSQLTPKRATQQSYHYTQPPLVVDPTSAFELIRVCHQTHGTALLPGVFERIYSIVAEEPKAEGRQSCMTYKLLLPLLSRLRSMLLNQDIPGIRDLATLAISLDVVYMPGLPAAPALDGLIAAIILGGGATTVKSP